ncbi:hypothetical protein F5B20DRAFT_594687 [Whalleya microplaca]|nr:hypothetical protein F5B20DRAFT_594687 [Whalleya microplaca]
MMAHPSFYLPPEILRMIIEFLSGDDITNSISGTIDYENTISSYAAVSKTWQNIVESISFRCITLTPESLPLARTIITPSRQYYLRKIDLHIVLPDYKDNRIRRDVVVDDNEDGDTDVETLDDQIRNQAVLDDFVRSFFNDILSTWNIQDICEDGIGLNIRIYSRSDDGYTTHVLAESEDPLWSGSERFQDSFLSVPRTLLPVPFISGLSIGDDISTRNLSGEGYSSLLRALPNVIRVDVWAHEKQYANQNHRNAYIELVRSLGPSVTSLLCHIDDIDQDQPPEWWHIDSLQTIQDMTVNGRDTLSESLHVLSYQLISLDVCGVFSPSLFWPQNTSTDSGTPFWPNLEILEVALHYVLPGGIWLFQKCRDEWNVDPFTGVAHFHWEANEDALNMLHAAVVRAVTKMPKIASLTIQCNLSPGFSHHFRLTVTKKRIAKAIWTSSPAYEPPRQVLDLWKMIAWHRSLYFNFVVKAPDES